MEPRTPQRNLRNSHLEKIHSASTPLNIPPSPFMKSLGYGTGVNVYRLERPNCSTGQNSSPWAIKRISQAVIRGNKEDSEEYNQRILKEGDILRRLKHPNIVGLRTITKDTNGVDTLVLECCNASLGLILEERYEGNKGSLPAHQTKKTIGDIAQALDYLHTEAKLLHADLKSFNILVKGDFEICKLCDFGVSLPLDANGVVNFKENPNLCYVGTSLWSAPEVINNEEIIRSSADIFSFGLVIYETIALVPPHTLDMSISKVDSSTDEQSITLPSRETSLEDLTFNEDLLYGTRPPLPQAFELTEEYNIIVELFYVCTNTEPSERPIAKEIWQSLQRVKDSSYE